MKLARRRILLLVGSACILSLLALKFYGAVSSRPRAPLHTLGDLQGSGPQAAVLEHKTPMARAPAGVTPDALAVSKPNTDLAHHIVVVVSQETGETVGGAVVVGKHRGSIVQLGTTLSDGRLLVTSAFDIGDPLMASAIGRGEGTAYVSHSGDTPITITIHPFSALTGRVQRVDGLLDSIDKIVVVGVPSRMLEGQSIIDVDKILHDPRVVVTTCSREGYFEFASALAGVQYDITCGGAGLVHIAPFLRMSPTFGHAELLVSHLYGARVRFTLPDGSLARIPITAGEGIRAQLNDENCQFALANSIARVLAGMPLEWLNQTRSTHALLAIRTDGKVEDVQADLWLSTPGLAHLQTSVSLSSATAGLRDVVVHVRQVSEVADIVVVFDEGYDQLCVSRVIGTLLLRDLLGHVIRLPVSTTLDSRAVLGPLPTGDYEWRFEWYSGTPLIGSAPVVWERVRLMRKKLQFSDPRPKAGKRSPSAC